MTFRARRGVRLALAWIGLMLWLACGGGGGGGSTGSSTIQLAPGFSPDPHTVTGEAGGPFNANTRNSACRGFIGAVSDHTLHLTQPFNHLRVAATSPVDVTLVIQMADGSYRCNDDADGTNPVVEGPFPVGMHRVYVGTYAQGTTGSYTLTVSQAGAGAAAVPGILQGIAPGIVPAGIGGSNYGTVTLSSGFVPDPQVSRGQAGGPVDASTLNAACRGHIAGRPDHLLQLNSNFANLRIMVNCAQDSTLVVQGPDGAYRCNDDAEGTNPIVQGPFTPGQYRVWVGSYTQGTTGTPYVIGFSELPTVSASSLQ